MPKLTVNDAVKLAKDWVKTAYVEEGLTQLGLEEVYFNEGKNQWRITLGFARPWNTPRTVASGLAAALGEAPSLKRTYKVVVVDDETPEVVSLENRADD